MECICSFSRAQALHPSRVIRRGKVQSRALAKKQSRSPVSWYGLLFVAPPNNSELIVAYHLRMKERRECRLISADICKKTKSRICRNYGVGCTRPGDILWLCKQAIFAPARRYRSLTDVGVVQASSGPCGPRCFRSGRAAAERSC